MTDKNTIERWLPRLDDKSNDVQQKAIEVLAAAATQSEGARSEVIPVLIEFAKRAKQWWLCNDVIEHTAAIPQIDVRWTKAFFDFYADIGLKNVEHASGNAYTRLYDLLERGAIAPNHPRLAAIARSAKKRLRANDGDNVRKPLFAIVDWLDDHAQFDPDANDAASFEWPTTEIAPAKTSLEGDIFRVDQGVLKLLGYSVGKQGVEMAERQSLLSDLYKKIKPLEKAHPQYEEWSEPHSADRLRKLANTIAALARNAKRRRSRPLAAISDWEADLSFLKRSFYDGVYDFRWPTSDA